jgi:hypothetical protein
MKNDTMNTHTHTPGEWKADHCTIYSGKTILAVAYCEGNRELHPHIHEKEVLPDSEGYFGDGWEVAWKNANLIAASPDLLAACKVALNAIRAHNFKQSNLGNCIIEESFALITAIAKAEGGEA